MAYDNNRAGGEIVVPMAIYDVKNNENLIVSFTSNSPEAINYGYLYGVKGVINSVSYANGSLTFPSIADIGSYNCRIASYIGDEFVYSNYFTVNVTDAKVPSWSINNIANQEAAETGWHGLYYSITDSTVISKHELSYNDGQTWEVITPSGNNDRLHVWLMARENEQICKIRCTDSNGAVATSNSFKLTVKTTEPPIDPEPPADNPPSINNVSNISGIVGDSIQITYTATDDNSITSHKFSEDGGNTWAIISPSKNGDIYTFSKVYTSSVVKNCKIKVIDSKNQETISNAFTITVTNNNVAVTEVTLNKSSVTLTVDESTTLYATVLPSNATNKNITWGSSNESVATINGGTITAKSEGATVITVSTVDGNKKATCSVVVNRKVVEPDPPPPATDNVKQDLFNSKQNYDTKYNSLINIIKNVIAKNEITVSDRNNISDALKNFSVSNSSIATNLERAIDNITSNKVFDSESRTNSKISEVDVRLGSITSRVSTVENKQTTVDGKVTDIETWKKSAEQKITDDAIVNVIESASEGDGTKKFAKKSEITQLDDSLTAKFTQSGGYNRLRNSGFKNDTNHWDLAKFGTCINEKIYTWDDSNQYVLPDKNSLVIQATNLSDRYGVHQNVKVIEGATYSISALSAGHRSTKQNITIRNRNDNDSHIVSIDASPSPGGKKLSNWNQMHSSFTIPTGCTEIMVCLYMKGDGTNDNAYAWFTDVLLTEGALPLSWSPHPAEVYDGITQIDKDGITVSMIEGEGLQGYSKVSYEGIATYDSDGATNSWFGANDSAYIKELNADFVNNPYLIQCRPRATNWYVGVYATGDGTGRDASNKSNSVNNILEYIRDSYGAYIYKQDININCDSGMDLNENIYIGGWTGCGVIAVYFGAGSTFTGYIKVEECEPSVRLDGNSKDWNTNDGCKWYREDGNTGNVALYVRNSHVLCRGFRAHRGVGLTTYGNEFVSVDLGSRVNLYNIDMVKFWSISNVTSASSLFVDNTRGDIGIMSNTVNSSMLCARAALPIFNNNKNIDKNYNSMVDISGVEGSNSLWMPKKVTSTDPPQPPPPNKTWKWMEKTVTLTGLKTTTEGSGGATSGKSGSWGQGKWGSYKSHRGHASISSSAKDFCSKARNITVTLTLTRLNTSHGYAGDTPKPKLKQPDGNFWNSNIGFARGSTKTITLPSSIANAIANGSMTKLEMWAGASTNDYSFYNATSIKIKCEKEV